MQSSLNAGPEIVANGVPTFGGAQLAVDPAEGKNALIQNSWVLMPERLVVLTGEIGGRWSEETESFIGQLAKAQARSEPCGAGVPFLRGLVKSRVCV